MLGFAGRAARAVLTEPVLDLRADLRRSWLARDVGRTFASAVACVTGIYLVITAGLLLILLCGDVLAGTKGFVTLLALTTLGLAVAVYGLAVGWRMLRWSWELRCELVSDGPRRVLFGSGPGPVAAE
jgi:hypothetical protein